MINCIKCGYEMIEHHRPTDWVVCPKCNCCGFYFSMLLKNRNLSINEARRRIANGDITIPLKGVDIIDGIAAAEYARSAIGNISGWSLDKFKAVVDEQTNGTVRYVKTPPLICVNKSFLDKTRSLTTCKSEQVDSHKCLTGINIPMMQEQNQYVGHSALFSANPNDTEGFVWRTYLHNFYLERPRGFLAYRPMNPGFETEILLVDNVVTYLKALGWFDVCTPKRTEAFPRNVMPVLVLGKLDYALDLLFDYMWNPWRITVLASNPNISDMLWSLTNDHRNLMYDELRVMPDKGFSGWKIRHCKTRHDVDELVLNNFTKIGGPYEKIESSGSCSNCRSDW